MKNYFQKIITLFTGNDYPESTQQDFYKTKSIPLKKMKHCKNCGMMLISEEPQPICKSPMNF